MTERHEFRRGSANYGQAPEDCFYCWGPEEEHPKLFTCGHPIPYWAIDDPYADPDCQVCLREEWAE